MTSHSIHRSRKPTAETCQVLRFMSWTPAISHSTRQPMRSPHWFEALSALTVREVERPSGGMRTCLGFAPLPAPPPAELEQKRRVHAALPPLIGGAGWD